MSLQFGQKIIDKLRGKNEFLQIHGFGNIVDAPKSKNLKIIIWGNNNKVYVDKSVNKFIGHIEIGWRDCPTDNSSVIIESNSTSNGTTILLLENDSHVKIGSECMFSSGIKLNCTDTHAIFDKDSKELLNKGKFITIGNHVWIGHNSLICKNSAVPDNCVVGACSVVTKEFNEKNSILAGIPAKVRKSNIDWTETRPNLYKKEM